MTSPPSGVNLSTLRERVIEFVATNMPFSSGTKLGPYEVVAPLGAGGMGEVYRARDTRLGRDVAVKVLPAAFSADAERLRRFEQEARAASALNHPNILAAWLLGMTNSTAVVRTEREISIVAIAADEKFLTA